MDHLLRSKEWQRLLRIGIAAAGLACLGSAHANSAAGAWQPFNNLPYFPVHIHTLPTGKVLMWPGDAGISGNDPRLLDPLTQTLTLAAKPGYDIFCTGHAFLADGQLFVAGGHISNSVGLSRASRYDAVTNSWINVPNMNAGRWYPTVTTLANGDALVVSGDIDSTVGSNPLPQVYQRATNTWRNLSSAQMLLPLYPMMFLAPNGRVVQVAPDTTTRSLDTSGTGQWTTIATRVQPWRDYGSAVMYADGKILTAGGGDPPQSGAEIIDLNQASPTWRATGSMSIARRQLNLTALPDGTVLATGGTSGSGFNNTATPVFAAELWNPDTGNWSQMASGQVPRLYHSAATLLPDGRVLVTGGNDQVTPEVFSPPYLFKGERPTVSVAPASIGYGQQFTVQTPEASGITKMTLIRLGSATHAFDENQRVNVLSFTVGSGSLNAVAPANGNIAPPGDYLLFLVNSLGVPSVGRFVRLGSEAPQPPPSQVTLTSLTPNTAVAGSPGFNLQVTGSGFVSGAAVLWNGTARATTFTSATQLSAQILAADVATAGTRNVTVTNDPGTPGAPSSNALPFTVTASGGGGTTTFGLTVTKTGSEARRGTVTSAPAGINCGTQCSASFASGTMVTLTPRVVGNVVFTGWTGPDACPGTGSCTVQMTAAKSVSANFVRR